MIVEHVKHVIDSFRNRDPHNLDFLTSQKVRLSEYKPRLEDDHMLDYRKLSFSVSGYLWCGEK